MGSRRGKTDVSVPAGTRRMPVDERRAQLLALGQELFSRNNPDDISIDDIAAAAGISKGLLYHYFGSKRAFYVASVRLAAEDLLAQTWASSQSDEEDELARLKLGLDAYLDHVAARAEGYAMLVTSGTADPDVREIIEQTRQAFISRLLDSVGLPEPPALLRTALRGWIAFVEVSCLDWIQHRDASREAVRDLLAHVLLATLQGAGGLAAMGSGPASDPD